MANKRISALTEELTPATSDVVPIDGATTRKTTIVNLVDAARPFASQAEAEAGSGTTQTMNPLASKQLVDYERTQARSFTAAQTFTTASSGTTVVKLESTAADGVGGPQLDLVRNSASPAANDVVGIIRVRGMNSAASEVTYANINTTILDATSGSEDARIILQVPVAGAQTAAVSIANGMIVGAPTGTYQGTGTLNATGYYLNGSALASTLFGVTPGTLGLALLDDADATTARTTLGLGSAAVLTSGDASGNLKALNADGGFTFATTATTVNVSGAFGGTWVTAHRAYSSDAATFAGSRTTATFMRAATGSGTNGPSRADYALHVEASKTDYLTSVVQGEIDGMNIVVRQGTLGDAGAILVNVQQVQNATYGLTAYEAASAIINSSGVKQQEMKVTLGGWLQGATDLRAGGFGVLVRPSDDGFTIDHGVLILGHSSVASTGVETAIRASSTLAEADTYFMVTGDEHADGAGRVYAQGAPIFLNETAIPANGTTGAGIMLSSTSNFGIFFGSGAPTLSAAKGSLYLRSDGSTTTNRAYINTNGTTAWTALTTAA